MLIENINKLINDKINHLQMLLLNHLPLLILICNHHNL